MGTGLGSQACRAPEATLFGQIHHSGSFCPLRYLPYRCCRSRPRHRKRAEARSSGTSYQEDSVRRSIDHSSMRKYSSSRRGMHGFRPKPPRPKPTLRSRRNRPAFARWCRIGDDGWPRFGWIWAAHKPMPSHERPHGAQTYRTRPSSSRSERKDRRRRSQPSRAPQHPLTTSWQTNSCSHSGLFILKNNEPTKLRRRQAQRLPPARKVSHSVQRLTIARPHRLIPTLRINDVCTCRFSPYRPGQFRGPRFWPLNAATQNHLRVAARVRSWTPGGVRYICVIHLPFLWQIKPAESVTYILVEVPVTPTIDFPDVLLARPSWVPPIQPRLVPVLVPDATDKRGWPRPDAC